MNNLKYWDKNCAIIVTKNDEHLMNIQWMNYHDLISWKIVVKTDFEITRGPAFVRKEGVVNIYYWLMFTMIYRNTGEVLLAN